MSPVLSQAGLGTVGGRRSRRWSSLGPDGAVPRRFLQTVYRHFGDPYDSLSDLESLSRQMTLNHFDVSLPSDMLRKVDMMSMRAGIEVRVPMLDEDLVGLALSLPHRMKTDGRTGKLVLRDM